MIGKRLNFLGIVQNRAAAAGFVKAPGDAVLVERGRPRLLVLSCPCGCGEELPINLDWRAGPAWRFYQHRRSGRSLFPSVWRETGCQSHFIIWRDRILVFGQAEEDLDIPSPTEEMKLFADAVLERLPDSGLISFGEIADSLDEIPWDVLTACRRLVRTGRAREGRGKQRGHFGRRF